MPVLNAYLNFPGNTEEAFKFYRSVFGGEFSALQRFKDTPEAGRVPETAKDWLMHIALPVGNGNTLMATDAVEPMGHKLTWGNNFHLSVEADSREQAQTYFQKLSDGAKVTQPLQDMFWGSYFGMLTDKFGIQWMIGHTKRS